MGVKKRCEMLVINMVIARFLLLVWSEMVNMSRSPLFCDPCLCNEQVVRRGMLSGSPYQGVF